MNVEDLPLADRLLNIEGIWEEHGFITQPLKFIENTRPGPNIPDDLNDPVSFFHCLFTEEFIEHLVFQTNNYAQQQQKSYEPCNSKSMKAFLAINILKGIKKQASYKDYWSSNEQLRDSYISSIMPVNRFSWFLSHLHVNDHNLQPKRNEPNFDKLYKVRPLLDSLSKTFLQHFNPNEYQSIDESMIIFKSRSSLKQYMPMKPVKRGYKVWIRAD